MSHFPTPLSSPSEAEAAATFEALRSAVPRMGWIEAPSPLQALEPAARELGIADLYVKRDDRIQALHGGNKARKLDVLLARDPLAAAPAWRAVGGIGSGNLVALAAAARLLGRSLVAHTFWQELTPKVVENLGFIASHAAELRCHRSRLALALRSPRVIAGKGTTALPVVPSGSTSPAGMLGMVLGGLELAVQVHAGLMPPPDRVYVALGSGGTAAGLAVGLGLGGLACVVHAVAVVERYLSGRRRLDGLVRAARAELAKWLPAARDVGAVPIVIDRRQLGPGYGRGTPAGARAQALLEAAQVPSEPAYTAKAMAALVADAVSSQGVALLWLTCHGGGLRAGPDLAALPPWLRARLVAVGAPGPSRAKSIVTESSHVIDSADGGVT